MRGGNGKAATVLRREFLADALHAVDFLHDQLDRFQHQAARLRQAADALAVACKNIHAQLFLQLDDGFRYARLRRKQGLGGVRQVIVLPDRFAHEAQLMEIHCWFALDCRDLPSFRPTHDFSVHAYTHIAYKQMRTK